MTQAMVAPLAHPSASANDEADFAHDEVELFEAEDTEAGANIGKMLSVFFLYTVLAMTVSAWVTWKWVMAPATGSSEAVTAQ